MDWIFKNLRGYCEVTLCDIIPLDKIFLGTTIFKKQPIKVLQFLALWALKRKCRHNVVWNNWEI